MRYLKQSKRSTPQVSLILLDWSVRESFHLLHYLGKQDIKRDVFEIIIIEYYSRESEAIRPFEAQVDSWILLDMPESCYYHKHLMYNVGIFCSRGEICVICDSDAIVTENFIRTIIDEFSKKPDIILHIDQFRNMRKDFYPFNYPALVEVLGNGCINNTDGITTGLAKKKDPIHMRNYGACMCAKKKNLIAIGGADEHIDYLGHICGPYDMTFRLVNNGCEEIWHHTEFMYHTWHPGQAGEDNYLGPHDGRHVSTTALESLASERILPLLENEAIKKIRTSDNYDVEKLISPTHSESWNKFHLRQGKTWIDSTVQDSYTNGLYIEQSNGTYLAYPKLTVHSEFLSYKTETAIHANDKDELIRKARLSMSTKLRIFLLVTSFILYIANAARLGSNFIAKRISNF